MKRRAYLGPWRTTSMASGFAFFPPKTILSLSKKCTIFPLRQGSMLRFHRCASDRRRDAWVSRFRLYFFEARRRAREKQGKEERKEVSYGRNRKEREGDKGVGRIYWILGEQKLRLQLFAANATLSCCRGNGHLLRIWSRPFLEVSTHFFLLQRRYASCNASEVQRGFKACRPSLRLGF